MSGLMRVITERVKIRAIGVELPIIPAIGKAFSLLPSSLTPEVFGGEDILFTYGRKYLDSLRGSEISSNIFSHASAEAEKGEKLDEHDVQLEAAGFIIAGTDTTALTLTYLVWAVLSQPALQSEVEQEVAALPSEFSEADVEKLPLLDAVIAETLRLYGAAPYSLPRAVPHGGATIGGTFVPAGTTVATQAYSFHRNAALFPNPYE